MIDWEDLLESVKGIAAAPSGRREKLEGICQLLADRVPHYHWVGFYIADDERKELTLGPFVGAPTEHVRIDYGSGICGRAAETGRALVVDDVSRESNYLSCSPKVRSEIVIPIFRSGKIVGELDIDSHAVASFTEEDRKFLEQVCLAVSVIL
jgi:L-methionine (R)-S-oxide reductase